MKVKAGGNEGSQSVRYLARYLAIAAPLFVAAPAWAQTDTTAFSKQVAVVSGDWEAEDWKAGTIKVHPAQFNEMSDHYLLLLAEEPAMGRTPLQAASQHFDGDAVNDNISRPLHASMADAVEAGSGLLVRPWEWTDTYGEKNVSTYGVLTTPANTYIPFILVCQTTDSNLSYEQCMRGGTSVIDGLRGVGGSRLTMPPTVAPINVASWRASVRKDGRTVARKSNHYSTVNAHLHVMPPKAIPHDQLAMALKAFSDSVIDDADNVEKDPGSLIAVGSNDDPWLRREFPSADEGTSIQMAGTAAAPDGRLALIGIRCPGEGWFKVCAAAVEQAKFQVRSGQMDVRMKAYLAGKEVPMPANGGIRTAQIMGIYGVHRINGIHPYFDSYLFLKDGSVFNDTSMAPQMVDPVKSKQENPGQWGRWRKVGSDLAITWGDGSDDTIEMSPGNQLLGGGTMRLSGRYGTISSSGSLIGGGSVSRSAYTFYPDGTFEKGSSSSFAVTGYAGGATPSTIASGASSNTSGRARYTIDGYMISFYYPSGEVERESFAISPRDANGNQPKQVYIGGVGYTLNLE